MRVLFDNIIGDATLSSVNALGAYPVQNLASQYIRERYQVSGTTDTITILFGEDVEVSDLFWGYTNIERMQVSFKDSAGDLVDLVYFENGNVAHYYGYIGGFYGYDDHYYGYYDVLSNHLTDPVAWHFDAITVRSIEIELEGPSGFYLGAIALGVAQDLGSPLAEWSESWDDRSLRSETQAGHVLQQYMEPLRSYVWTLPGMTRDQANTLRDLYREAGIGKRLWVDAFENNHAFMEPLYCSLVASVDIKKSGKDYSASLAVKEAR